MALVDNVRSLAEEMVAIPSTYALKVVRIILSPSEKKWREEVSRHHAAMGNYPKGSKMYLSAQSAYITAFQNWSRVSFTLKQAKNAENMDLFSEAHLKHTDKIPVCFVPDGKE